MASATDIIPNATYDYFVFKVMPESRRPLLMLTVLNCCELEYLIKFRKRRVLNCLCCCRWSVLAPGGAPDTESRRQEPERQAGVPLRPGRGDAVQRQVV